MKRTIAAITLSICLFGGTLGSVYADETGTSANTQVSTETISSSTTPGAIDVQTQSGTSADENAITDSAGILPTSPFYGIERAIEQLQIAITRSQEKLAALKAQLANERAAEAVVMANEGKDELAGEATVEYVQMLALAVNHINNAIEAKDEAVKTLDALNKSYTNSQELLKSLLENASTSTKKVIEAALTEQDKAVTAINDFYTAKKAFFYAKDQLKIAQIELQAAKKSGEAAAIKAAEEKIQTAEAVKDELEAIKDAAEKAKEEVKNLEEQAQKLVETGIKEVEKADDTIEKITENETKDADKQVDKAKKEEGKQQKKEARKQAQEIAKDAREDAKEIAKAAKENAKHAAEKAREDAKNKVTSDEDMDED